MRPDALRRRADQIERGFDRADGEFQREADDQLAHLEQQLTEVVAENQRLRDRLQEVDPESPPLCEQCSCPKCRNRDPAMTDHAKTQALVQLMDPEVVARLVAQAEAIKPTVVKTAKPEPVSVDATETGGPEADDTDPAMDNDARPDGTLPPGSEPSEAQGHTPSLNQLDGDDAGSLFSGLNDAQAGGASPQDYGRELRRRLDSL